MQINIELLPGGKMPTKANKSDAGFDLYANITKPINLYPGGIASIPVGVILELPDGYEAQIRSRSGLALKEGVIVLNSPGTIDAGYRNELCVILHNANSPTERTFDTMTGEIYEHSEPFMVMPKMKIAQMVIQEVLPVDLIIVDNVNKNTDRSNRGFGSSGLQ